MTDVRVTARARTPLAAAGVARLAEAVVRAERARVAALSVTFIGPARIRSLNRTHKGKDTVTDVIAFGLANPAGPLVGDIYICPAIASRNAKRAGTTLKDELRRLVVHGVLHVLGYDHPFGAAERVTSAMWRRQERYLAKYGTLAR